MQVLPVVVTLGMVRVVTGLLVVVALLTDVATAGLSAVCWR